MSIATENKKLVTNIFDSRKYSEPWEDIISHYI